LFFKISQMKLLLSTLILVSTHLLFAQNTKSILKKYSKEVQKIIHSESKAFRGFSFGDSKELIKSQEVLKIHSETDTVITYTLMLDADDTADLIYYFDSTGKAKSFAVIFILGDEKEEQVLRDQLTKYYNEKYGMYAVINQEDELWDSKLGHLIEMRDTSDETGMEIEILYYLP
jgi:DNA-directed RNA polymerase beta' subunit